MRVIVDANIFAGYFRAKAGLSGAPMTGDPCVLLDHNCQSWTIVFDDTRHIESEWVAVVPCEWAEAWIGDAMIAGKIEYRHATVDPSLVAMLKTFGFPLQGSHDVWYLRLADTLVSGHFDSVLVTEDLDFYDPKQKGKVTGKARLSFLRQRKGRLLRELQRRRKIRVECVGALLP